MSMSHVFQEYHVFEDQHQYISKMLSFEGMGFVVVVIILGHHYHHEDCTR